MPGNRSAQNASASSSVGRSGAARRRLARSRLRTRPVCGTVAHLTQVVRMRKDESPVGEIEDVELQHVAAELDREL